MKRAYIFAFTLVGFTYLPVSATIINIPDDYLTIQEGIDASTDGDTVLVQPGTYVENIDFDGNNIVLSSIFLLTGDTLHISSTIIDGDSSGTVIEFWDGVTASVTGFTIQNGYQLFAPGGIYCGIDSRPFIMNNRIMNNTGSSSAGGIFIREGSFPTIKNNFISENFSSGSGGGIFCGGEAIIINNIIIENSSVLWGGGIDCFRAYPLIANNIISHNLSREGGGIFFHSSDPFIMNNIISGNVADSTGGGIECFNSNPFFINTILRSNESPMGSQIYLGWNSSLILEYCNIQGGYEGEGNIDLDPLFRDPDNGDFHLMSTACGDPFDSPCIDVGHPDILDSLLDCTWGLGTILSDMGAYGGGDSVLVGIDQHDIPIPQMFSLAQNYPNPFNTQTIIRYSLPEPSEVIIDIYDILGRKIETLIQGEQPAGYHQVTWDATDRSSGMYFYRIEAEEYSDTKKMVLLK